MNIQFMTEKNGIPTGEFDWLGRERLKYVPDFEELVKNASCEEEIEAIRECEERIHDKFFDGFAFSIVYTDYAKTLYLDKQTGKTEMGYKWQVMQHPWYEEEDGRKVSKERMLEDIEAMKKDARH